MDNLYTKNSFANISDNSNQFLNSIIRNSFLILVVILIIFSILFLAFFSFYIKQKKGYRGVSLNKKKKVNVDK